MQRDPLSVDVWREMAQLSFTVGRYDEAIDLLQRIRAVEPQLPFADLFLARALACAGRVDEAMTCTTRWKRTDLLAPRRRATVKV
jgi:tetratricopeptide (TPR) repeat protein